METRQQVQADPETNDSPHFPTQKAQAIGEVVKMS